MRTIWGVALAAAGAGYVALAVVGVRSWRRTASLRDGRSFAGAAPSRSGVSRTHMVTLIPGWCGVAVCAVGAFGAESRLIPIALGSTLAGAGCFVAVSGFRRRVVAVEVGSDGIAVRHRSGDPFRTRWAEIDELRSPRWPMGGWTIVAGGRRCTLMPSDLWGKEAMLELVAEAAGYLTMN